MNKEKIATEYLPLVKSIANKYAYLGVPSEDLEQEGMIGLLEAADKFREDKGAKFSTYATYWIKKKILSAIDKEKKGSLDSIKLTEESVETKEDELKTSQYLELPQNMPDIERKILRMLYEEQLTLKEIAQELKISRERVRQLKEKALRRMRVKL
ncbi:MAG: sigma-70 family RNA polymerase sigma factor [Candidatus Cloacimonetes bacterium]|nr:sigma-70 family RNA polymerase sigma factor [Candidatus Cloacimonadota bacterium]